MRDERTQTTSLKDVCILVPRATQLNLEPTNKRRALGTRMGRLRGGYFVANLWNLLEQCGWSTTHKPCLRDSLTSSRFCSLSINVWNSGYVSDIFPGGGGGGTPSYKLYRYMPPHRVGFLLRSGLKTLSPFRSGIGYGFWGNYGKVWTYLSFQFRLSKKEREICVFEMY